MNLKIDYIYSIESCHIPSNSMPSWYSLSICVSRAPSEIPGVGEGWYVQDIEYTSKSCGMWADNESPAIWFLEDNSKLKTREIGHKDKHPECFL